MEKVKSYIENWIKRYFEDSKAKYLIIGLSGGLDSSMVLKLVVNAVGSKKVIALILPETGITLSTDIKDAKELAKELGVKYKIMEINKIVKNFISVIPHLKKDKKSLANLRARVRANILYSMANLKKGLVVGTTNKSEFYIGYFTKYGDGAADIYPILDLYKTDVKKLAEYVNIPNKIINKKPSPGLWKGQTAEGEIGLSYELIDRILYYKIDYEKELSNEEIARILGIKVKDVEKIESMIKNTEHKRNFLKFPIIKDIYGR
ncbi:MAG: NAD+ synthase [Candidatus Aenigmarchaeota archaeon]|nr:NAD+ synthase [Candidatus Aenigmarchaeota archaeon]MDW8149724.1 NAD+ synthase [Candidatus Aenigmarchaeota archaeon]